MKEKPNDRVSEEEESEKEEVADLQNAGSDDDWQPAEEKGRKRPARNSNRKSYADDGGESDEVSEEEAPSAKKARATASRGRGRGRGRGRSAGSAATSKSGGRGSRASKSKEEEEEDEDNPPEKDEDMEDSSSEESEDDDPAPPQYQSGCFVVLKKEYDEGGNHPLWKIDGKSLLQKYVPSEENGEKSFVSTTIYAGWSKACIDKYYPAVVVPLKQDGRDHYVRLEKAEV